MLCAVLGTIIYRLSLVSVIYGGGGSFFKKHAKIVTSVSAALINLIIIMCLTRVRLLVTYFYPLNKQGVESPRATRLFEEINFKLRGRIAKCC